MKNKKRQQHNLWQVFELCGSLRLPCHVALSPIGLGHITAAKRKMPQLGIFPNCSLWSQLRLAANVTANAERPFIMTTDKKI